MKILIIEDMFEIANIYRKKLKEAQMEADLALNGKDAISALKKNKYNLIILDLNLPDVYGLDLLEKIKEFDSHIPIIIITARNDENLIAKSLNLGADDYLRKPVRYDELVARIRVIDRRNNNRTENQLIVDDLKVDLNNSMVFYKDLEIKLTQKEYIILCNLMRKYPGYITKNELASLTYDEYLDENSSVLRVHIFNLKRKLTKFYNYNVLVNDKSKGYRICFEQ